MVLTRPLQAGAKDRPREAGVVMVISMTITTPAIFWAVANAALKRRSTRTTLGQQVSKPPVGLSWHEDEYTCP